MVGHWSQTTAVGVRVDNTPPVPGKVHITDSVFSAIFHQPSPTSITARWTDFHDNDSFAVNYHWAIGSRPGGAADILPYTDVRRVNHATANLKSSLKEGTMIFVSVLVSSAECLKAVIFVFFVGERA